MSRRVIFETGVSYNGLVGGGFGVPSSIFEFVTDKHRYDLMTDMKRWHRSVPKTESKKEFIWISLCNIFEYLEIFDIKSLSYDIFFYPILDHTAITVSIDLYEGIGINLLKLKNSEIYQKIRNDLTEYG